MIINHFSAQQAMVTPAEKLKEQPRVTSDKEQTLNLRVESIRKCRAWKPPGRSPLGLPPLAALDSKSITTAHDEYHEVIEIKLASTSGTTKKYSAFAASRLPTNRASKCLLATVSVASVLALAGLNLQQKNRGNAPLASQYSAPAAPSPWALAAGCLIFLTVSASLFIQSFSSPSSPIKPRDKTSSDRLPSCMIEL